jgi:hypothetical protein
MYVFVTDGTASVVLAFRRTVQGPAVRRFFMLNPRWFWDAFGVRALTHVSLHARSAPSDKHLEFHVDWPLVRLDLAARDLLSACATVPNADVQHIQSIHSYEGAQQ